MSSNHGTCTNNKNECKQVTINSEICFSRDDVTPQTPHDIIQVSIDFIVLLELRTENISLIPGFLNFRLH